MQKVRVGGGCGGWTPWPVLASPMRLTPLSDQYKIGSKVVYNKNLFWDCLVGHILIIGITTIKNVYYNEKNCCNNICVITIVDMSCHYKI